MAADPGRPTQPTGTGRATGAGSGAHATRARSAAHALSAAQVRSAAQAQHGPAVPLRFPGADSLGERGRWDAATRRVVMDRVHNVPRFQRFTGESRRTLEALCDRVVPQPERTPDERVPIAPWIDQRCSGGAPEGFRFEGMPPLPKAWEAGLRGLDETAIALSGRPFADLDPSEQDAVLESVRHGDPPGETWAHLPARRWWIQVALRGIVGVYYAHPRAWDEIGFGGPAYPRGYAALHRGAREPWEAEEDADARRADLARDRRARPSSDPEPRR